MLPFSEKFGFVPLRDNSNLALTQLLILLKQAREEDGDDDVASIFESDGTDDSLRMPCSPSASSSMDAANGP